MFYFPDGFRLYFSFRASAVCMRFNSFDAFDIKVELAKNVILFPDEVFAREIANTSHLAKNTTQIRCTLFSNTTLFGRSFTISCQLICQMRCCSRNLTATIVTFGSWVFVVIQANFCEASKN